MRSGASAGSDWPFLSRLITRERSARARFAASVACRSSRWNATTSSALLHWRRSRMKSTSRSPFSRWNGCLISASNRSDGMSVSKGATRGSSLRQVPVSSEFAPLRPDGSGQPQDVAEIGEGARWHSARGRPGQRRAKDHGSLSVALPTLIPVHA